MSDPSSAPNGQGAPGPSPTPAPATPAGEPSLTRGAKWRKRIIRLAALLLIVAMGFRVLLSLLLPWTLHRVARVYGLDITFERADLYAFSSDAGLWHVNVVELDNGATIASVDYCRADISALNLLRGRLVVQRVEADGVELNLTRDADGTVGLLKNLLAGQGQAAPPPAAAAAPAKPAPIDLTPPVAIDALRLTHVRTHITDNAVSPPFKSDVDLNLRFSDLASAIRPAKFELEMLPSPLLDSVVIKAEGRTTARSLDATFSVRAMGLHPGVTAGYLAPLGIRTTADALSAEATGDLALVVPPAAPEKLAGTIHLADLRLASEGRDVAALKTVKIDLSGAAPGQIAVEKILLSTGTFAAARTAAGALSVAGFELAPAPPPAGTKAMGTTVAGAGAAPAPGTPAPAAPASASPAAPPPMRLSVGEFEVKDFTASFRDAAVDPATDLRLVVNDFSLKNLLLDPDHRDAAVAMTAELTAPGLAGAIALSGSCAPFAAKRTAVVQVHASGVRPDAVKPYLDRLNIESTLKEGDFTCQLSADLSLPDNRSLTANAQVKNLRWRDGQDLLTFSDIDIAGVGLAPGSIKVASVDIIGPQAIARRESNGALWAGGFRLNLPSSTQPAPHPDAAPTAALAPAARTAPVAPATAPSPAALLATLPKIDLGRFSWRGVRLSLDDAANPDGGETRLGIDDAGVELSGLHVDFSGAAPAASPAHLHAFLKAPGLAGDVDLKGTLTQLPHQLSGAFELQGKDLSALLAGPYLKALRIEPTMRDGTMRARAKFDVAAEPDGLRASASASDVALGEAGEELLGVASAEVSDVHLTDQSLEVGQVQVVRPRATLRRDADGALAAAGFRLLPAPPAAPKPAFASAPATQPAIPATQPVALSATQPAQQPAAPPARLVLKKLSVQEGSLRWIDRALASPAIIAARADGTLEHFAFGQASRPADFHFALQVDQTVEQVAVDGTLGASDSSAEVRLTAAGRGIRQGALAPYLPPGARLELKDGRFAAAMEAGITLDQRGWIGGHLLVHDVDFRDGPEPQPLFAFESARVVVPRVDLPGGVVAVDEISIAGVRGRAALAKDGTLRAMGLAIGAPPPASPATQPSAAAAAAPGASAPGGSAAPTAIVLNPTTRPAGPIVIVRPKYPLLTIGRLDASVSDFTFASEAPEGAAPVVISDLHFFAAHPIELLGDDPFNRPGVDLQLALRVNGILDSLAVHAQATPFAKEPAVAIDVIGSGLNGAGLLAVAPQLSSQVDGAPLTAGRFHASLAARLSMDRLDPVKFDFDRAFGGELTLRDVEFRAQPAGPILAGVEEVHSENIQVRPSEKAAGGKEVRIKTVEINNLVARASRETDGIHLLGIVLKTAAPATPAKPPAATPAEKVATTAPAPVAAPAAPPPAVDVRIDRVQISGADFRVTDNTVAPPLIVPINQLDVDIRGLSTTLLSDADQKVRFTALVGAGKTPLPRRVSRNALTGGLTDAARLLTGQKIATKVVIEQRDLFSQMQADGELSLYPLPKGWLKATVSGFDLAALSSEVKPYRVDLKDGVFDSSVDARLPGDGSLQSVSHLTFSDLDLNEPPDGPIRKFLLLPAPTDQVQTLLQGADGAIDVPLAVNLSQGKLSGAAVVSAAVNAFGAIVTRAIEGAGAKGVHAATDVVQALIPFRIPFLPHPEDDTFDPVEVRFAAGDDGLTPQALSQVQQVAARLKARDDLEVTLQSELTGGAGAVNGDPAQFAGDIARASSRANPTPEEGLELIDRLSRRRSVLSQKRAVLLGVARGDLAVRSPDESRAALERLRALERELSATEEALDRLYDLQRPGASRLAMRRTRQAAVALGDSRQQSIRAQLAAADIPRFEKRIHFIHTTFAPTADTGGGKVIVQIKVKRPQG